MNPDDGIVYHYTSHDAAASIVRNEEMWLTNILYLNDVKEFWGTFDRVREYIQERSTANDPVKVEIVEHVNRFIERRPGTSICVTCFSGHADDAAQWQRYASQGGGVALGFKRDKLVEACKAHEYLFADSVQYDRTKTTTQIDTIVRAVEDAIRSGQRENAVNPLIRLAAFVKDQSFASEKEFRFARQGVPYTEYRFFSRSDNLVPYYCFPLKRDCIARIQLGSKSDPECQYSWELMLSQIGNGSIPHDIIVSRSTSGLK
jgi:hypothetical protein